MAVMIRDPRWNVIHRLGVLCRVLEPGAAFLLRQTPCKTDLRRCNTWVARHRVIAARRRPAQLLHDNGNTPYR